MKRRSIISACAALGAGTGIFTASDAVRAQPAGKVWRIGFLSNGSGPDETTATLRAQLAALGYQEGRNLVIEFRWGAGREARLQELASELVRIKVELIIIRGQQAAAAAKRATDSIPIVMSLVADPVGTGIVASLARPGGNITGVSIMATDLAGKRVQLLREMLPKLVRVAVLVLKGGPATPQFLEQLQGAARQTGITLAVQQVNEAEALTGAFAAWRLERSQALIVQASPFTADHRKQIIELAVHDRLPTIFENRGPVDVGGLMSYGANGIELQRRVASQVDKIFKGTKPADLPVEQPTQFEMVINLKTATALGLTVPHTIRLQATEMIE